MVAARIRCYHTYHNEFQVQTNKRVSASIQLWLSIRQLFQKNIPTSLANFSTLSRKSLSLSVIIVAAVIDPSYGVSIDEHIERDEAGGAFCCSPVAAGITPFRGTPSALPALGKKNRALVNSCRELWDRSSGTANRRSMPGGGIFIFCFCIKIYQVY